MANSSYGRYTYGKLQTHSWPEDGKNAKLIVGNFCSIAGGSAILGGNHRTDWVTTFPFGHIHKHIFNTFDGEGHPTTKGDIIIGNDVWIGGDAVIMSGVKVGDGAVIANHAHVVKDVPPYSIVGGNPAKVIRYRFTEEQIKKLLEIKWWNWSDEKINENIPLLCNKDIDIFINKFYPL